MEYNKMVILQNVSDMATATDETGCEIWGGGGYPTGALLTSSFHTNSANQNELPGSMNCTERSAAMHVATPAHSA
jgi:hypothetical protein